METRPVAIRFAEVGLAGVALSGGIQAARFASMFPVLEMHWALPAGIAVIATAILVGLHQQRAVARPLAMMVFGGLAIRGAVSLSQRSIAEAGWVGLLAVCLVAGAMMLAAWFGLSGAAGRDLSRS